ncbi:hypothetical protein Taro_001649 [Colocasia esculenta]|uniref:Transmembrane protein 220 n=1 Tax=Colocasia esculenta TaxID=4460 RepID=A0A843TF49_COLES|nr:hypothetical protein [Colocasia esculenta]
MPKHRSRSLVFSSCSILMASLFAYSASVQLDDPDWYLWLPLYALATAVNLFHIRFASKSIEMTARAVLLLGSVLFLKVVVEDYTRGIAGFWSLDMRERVVREKLGSGLVVASMFLHLKASPAASERKPPMKGRNKNRRGATTAGWVDYGMAVLVAVSYGLSYCFFKFVIGEMKKM